MKTGAALFLSAVLATLCGSFVDANGVCYDPNHTADKNADSVAKDIVTIKSKGFTYVRTYISKFGNTDMVKQLASSGLKVVAGVPFGQGDYATQLEAAVSAVSTGNVVYIMLGNENLANFDEVPSNLIQAIKDLKARVPGVKVGTVQRNTEFLKNIRRLDELVAACDVIGVNIHPYFMGSQNGNGMETTKSQWNKIIGSGIPGIADKLFLGETGWPSDGSNGANQGTVAGASAYFSAYKAWSASLPENKKFYFQLFDQEYKPEAYEKAYGLLTYDSQDKFGGASVPASTTAAPTTAPTSAPTPASSATPAPSATSANATSSSSSSSSSSGSSSKELKSAGSGSADSLATVSSKIVASSSSSSSAESESTTTEGETGAEAEIAGVNGRTTVDTPINTDKSQYAGASSDSTETNTQSSGGGSSVGVAFGVAAGCAAVLGAFGFIYHTRKKAQELEAAEGKMSFAVTPHGGCVL